MKLYDVDLWDWRGDDPEDMTVDMVLGYHVEAETAWDALLVIVPGAKRKNIDDENPDTDRVDIYNKGAGSHWIVMPTDDPEHQYKYYPQDIKRAKRKAA